MRQLEQMLRCAQHDKSRCSTMRPNPLAPWELRIGNLRVYYDVGVMEEQVVSILAVGVKRRNRVYIGGKEFVL